MNTYYDEVNTYAFYLRYALAAEKAHDNQKVCYWLRKALAVKV